MKVYRIYSMKQESLGCKLWWHLCAPYVGRDFCANTLSHSTHLNNCWSQNVTGLTQGVVKLEFARICSTEYRAPEVKLHAVALWAVERHFSPCSHLQQLSLRTRVATQLARKAREYF